MTDPTTNQQAAEPQQATPAVEAAPQSATTQEQTPANVPYERFKEVNEKYKTLEAQLKEMQSKQKEEEDKRLKEQGDYKKLFEDLQTKYTTEQKTNMKLKLASSKGLPVDLINRVQGETEEEIGKDIDSLLAFMKKETPQGVPPPPRGGSSTNFDFANATPAQIREYLEKQKTQ
jgi:vacuolar-type H+-ATPase subunit I/STV1